MEGSRRDGILPFAAALRGGYHSQDERLEIDKSTAREQELRVRLVECLQQRAAVRGTGWLADQRPLTQRLCPTAALRGVAEFFSLPPSPCVG